MKRLNKTERVIALILIWVALVIGYIADAKADVVGFHIASHHAPAREYNNFNPGMYYRHDSGGTVGLYWNSYKRWSPYVGYTYVHPLADGEYDLGMTAGVVFGYQKCTYWYAQNSADLRRIECQDRVKALLVPSVSKRVFGDWRARLSYTPRFQKEGRNRERAARDGVPHRSDAAHVLHISVERTF